MAANADFREVVDLRSLENIALQLQADVGDHRSCEERRRLRWNDEIQSLQHDIDRQANPGERALLIGKIKALKKQQHKTKQNEHKTKTHTNTTNMKHTNNTKTKTKNKKKTKL